MQSERLKRRLRALKSMKRDISHFQIKMEFSAMPVLDVLAHADSWETKGFWDKLEDSLSCNPDSFSAAWREALDQMCRNDMGFAALSADEKNALNTTSEAIGVHDMASQKKAMDLALLQLGEVIEKLGAVCEKKSKLYCSIGMLCGAAAAILIW